MNTQSKKSGLVWGGLLIVFGVLALLETVTDLGAWVWVAVLTIGGLLVYGLYATDRTEKWLLIISYAMLAVAGLVTLLTLGVLDDPYVATYVLLAIAFPFLVAFLRDRTKWGLLIPAYVLLAVGVFVPLTELGVLDDNLTVTYILFAVAIPFFVVFIRNSKNWWALIPGGILAIIGLSFLIAEASVEYIFAAVLIVAGILIVVRQFTKGEEPPQVEEPGNSEETPEGGS
jgi:predicted membrane protein